MADHMESQSLNQDLLEQISQLTEMLIQATQKIDGLLEEIENLRIENRDLKANAAYYQRILYGRKTEKLSKTLRDPMLISLFDLDYPDSPEDVSKTDKNQKNDNDDDSELPGGSASVKGKKKYNGQRKDKLANLPHKKIMTEVKDSDKICPYCGNEMEKIGEKFLGSKVIIHPATIEVLDYYAPSFKCGYCEEASETVIQTAENEDLANPVIPGSFASASAAAYVLYERYFKGMTYNRLAQEFHYKGWGIARRTLSNWGMYISENWFSCIYDLLHKMMQKRDLLHADESRILVLNEEDRNNATESWMWVYSTGQNDLFPIRLFDYSPTRSSKNPKEFLEDFNGILVTDGYQAYNAVEGAERAGCWAHLRRKFYDVLPTDAKLLTDDNMSVQAIKKIQEIFRIEKEISNMPHDERKNQRQSRIKPLVDEFFAWAKDQKEAVKASSKKAQAALTYCINQEERLRVFLDNGNVPNTNSIAERCVRPFAVGRKNWMFAGSPRGAEASAIHYSIVETAKANLLNPYKYILYLLNQLPKIGTKDEGALECLLPWDPEVQSICGIA